MRPADAPAPGNGAGDPAQTSPTHTEVLIPGPDSTTQPSGWRGIVERHGCGVCVDPADERAIAAALQAILSDAARAGAMGAAGRAAVLTEYNWPVAERELFALYRDLIGPP